MAQGIDEKFGLRTERNLSEVYVPPSTVGENVSAGIGLGFKETSIGLIQDLTLKQKAKRGENLIEQNDWNESHPYYVDDIDWYDELTTDVAKNIRDYRAQVEEASILSQRASGWGKAAQFGGTFVGAMLDPINIVPVGFGASLLGKSLAIGVGNAILDTAIYAPLAESTEEIRGRDLTFKDHAINAGFAFGAGYGLSVLGTGFGKFARAMQTTKTGDTALIKETTKHESAIKDSNIAPSNTTIDINAAHSRGSATKVSGTASTSNAFIRNFDIDTLEGAVHIDARGIVFEKGDAGRVKLEIDADGSIKLTGKIENVARILPTIRELSDIDTIKISSEGKVETLTPDIIDARINEIVTQQNVNTQLGGDKIDRFRVLVGDERYDLEIDEVTGEITAGYIVKQRKNGQLRRGKKLTKDELEAVKTQFLNEQDSFVANVNATARAVDETADAVNTDARSGKEQVNENSQKVITKLNDTDGNEQAAVNAVRGSNFVKNTTPEGAMAAFLSQPIVSERTMQEIGFRIVKDDAGNRTLIPINNFDAGKLDVEQTAFRNTVVAFQNKVKELQTTREAKKKFHTCMITNGA